MIQKFGINFWIWWYFIKLPESVKGALRMWLFIFAFTNTYTMVRNIFTPLYQDYSAVGRVTSLIIRLIWSTFGLIIQGIVTIPLGFYMLIMLILPFVPLIMILWGVSLV